jgi:hypothetical protein
VSGDCVCFPGYAGLDCSLLVDPVVDISDAREGEAALRDGALDELQPPPRVLPRALMPQGLRFDLDEVDR